MSNRILKILKADPRSLDDLVSPDGVMELLKNRRQDVSKLAEEYVSNQEKVSPTSGKLTRQRFDKAARKDKLVLAVLRHAIQVGDLELFVGDPRYKHALAIEPSAHGPVEYVTYLHTAPFDDTIFTVRNDAILPKSNEDDLRNKPYYLDKSEIQKLFGVDLWGQTNARQARRSRSEAPGDKSKSPRDKSKTPGGRPPKYDWPVCINVALDRLHETGITLQDNGEPVRGSLKKLVSYMASWCDAKWNEEPSEERMKKYAGDAIKEFLSIQLDDK